MEYIPSEQFLPAGEALRQVATRPIPKQEGAWGRFRKNHSSVVAAVLILLLLLFAIFGPIMLPYDVSTRDGYYKNLLPKWEPLAFLGWNGCITRSGSQAARDYYGGIGVESGESALVAFTATGEQ